MTFAGIRFKDFEPRALHLNWKWTEPLLILQDPFFVMGLGMVLERLPTFSISNVAIKQRTWGPYSSSER